MVSFTTIHPATSEQAVSITKPGNGGQTTPPQTTGLKSTSAYPHPPKQQDQATSPPPKSTPSSPTSNGKPTLAGS